MSWYRFAKDYIDLYTEQIQNKDKALFTNSPDIPKPVKENNLNLESALETERENIVKNDSFINEARQPVTIKSTGQGAPYLLESKKDLPLNQDDNYTRMSDWNTN